MEFFNKTEKGYSLDVNDEIGFWGINHQTVKAQLDEANGSDITLNISSLGGDVNHAFAIYNLLKSHSGRVVANIYGDAASAATIIALGADEVRMAENVFFMIHNVWTMAVGNANEMREQAELMDKFDNQIKNVYKKKTGLNRNKITSLMNNETWMTAQEAKEYGFVDVVTQSEEILNRNEAKIFNSLNKNVAKELINKINNKKSTEMEIDTEKVASGIFASLKEMFAKENKEVSDEKLQNAANAQAETLKAQFEEALTKAETQITELTNKVSEVEETLNAKVSEVETLAEENAKLQASKTTVESKEDTEDVVSEDTLAFASAIKNLTKKVKNIR